MHAPLTTHLRTENLGQLGASKAFQNIKYTLITGIQDAKV